MNLGDFTAVAEKWRQDKVATECELNDEARNAAASVTSIENRIDSLHRSIASGLGDPVELQREISELQHSKEQAENKIVLTHFYLTQLRLMA